MTGGAPERTCLVCRRRRSKAELVRIVRSPSGVEVDVGGSAPGRGGYVCADEPSCREGVRRRGAVARALRVALSPDDLLRLATELKEKAEG